MKKVKKSRPNSKKKHFSSIPNTNIKLFDIFHVPELTDNTVVEELKEEEEEEEEGEKKGGGGEECEKAKIMTEKADQTATGLAQSRDLFESEAEDNLKRSQSCVCNNIVCDCDENPDSLSLLDNF